MGWRFMIFFYFCLSVVGYRSPIYLCRLPVLRLSNVLITEGMFLTFFFVVVMSVVHQIILFVLKYSLLGKGRALHIEVELKTWKFQLHSFSSAPSKCPVVLC